jgi:LPS-assembly lipoprotein
MWWPDARPLLALALAVMLAGCGFSPVYAPGSPAAERLGRIAVQTEATLDGDRLRTALDARLDGPAAQATQDLTVTVTIIDQSAAVAADGTRARVNLVGVARWQLVDRATGAVLAQGQEDSFTGYATTGSTVATQAARMDAAERLAVILADLIVARLALVP